jgi:hypothetical protein
LASSEHRFVAANPYALFSTGELVSSHAALRKFDELTRALADGGTTGMLWHASVCGKALYHTKVGTRLAGDPRLRGRRIEAMLAESDCLVSAMEICRRHGFEFLAVVRPYDDYFPGLGSAFEAAHQDYLWESRDGEFRLRGVMSMAHPETAEYRLELIEELCGYRPDGIVIDVESTASAMTPFRRRDFFGFNTRVADEHRSRFGEDIRTFDDVQYRRGPDLQIIDASYVGGDFDRAGWHTIKGEFFARFLDRASQLVKGKGLRFGLSRGKEEGIMPMARMALEADKWLSQGVIDDLFLPRGEGEDRELGAYLESRRNGSRVISGSGTHGADGSVAWLAEAKQAAQASDSANS